MKPEKLDEMLDNILKSAIVTNENSLRKSFDVKEQFNFGEVRIEDVYENKKIAKEFMENSVFQFPFEKFSYRFSYIGGRLPLHLTMVVKVNDLYNIDVLCAARLDGKNTIYFGAQCSEEKVTIGYLQDLTFNNKESFTTNLSYIVYAGLYGLTMLLLTKNVPKTRVAPDEKLNKARIKNGKFTLPYVTTIDMRAYREASENTRRGTIGTRSSPRPHLRRAHLRHITVDGVPKVIPIHAMMINWDGKEPLGREEYKVLT